MVIMIINEGGVENNNDGDDVNRGIIVRAIIVIMMMLLLLMMMAMMVLIMTMVTIGLTCWWRVCAHEQHLITKLRKPIAKEVKPKRTNYTNLSQRNKTEEN